MIMSRNLLALALALAFLLSQHLQVYGAQPVAAAAAKLTERHGTVFKRGFVDWSKELWGDPQPALAGDTLYEGMQVGTGDRSWAQISWPNATTRAWSNTVVALAPNQRLVYLLSGEMLFNLDKHRKDRREFFVWTKVLSARIRGTTVLVQCTPEISRITVLEGVVEVLNRLDRSLVRIKPGVVYEVRVSNRLQPAAPTVESQAPSDKRPATEMKSTVQHDSQPAAGTDTDQPEAMPAPDGGKGTAGETNQTGGSSQTTEPAPAHMPPTANGHSVNAPQTVQGALLPLEPASAQTPPQVPEPQQVVMEDAGTLPVFHSNKCTTSLMVASPDQLKQHPLVTGFETPLASMPLIRECLQQLPACLNPMVSTPGEHYARGQPVIDKNIIDNSTILRGPLATNYSVGQGIGTIMPLPHSTMVNSPPIGVINSARDEQMMNSAVAPADGLRAIRPMDHMRHQLDFRVHEPGWRPNNHIPRDNLLPVQRDNLMPVREIQPIRVVEPQPIPLAPRPEFNNTASTNNI